jgi:hypothetical protein
MSDDERAVLLAGWADALERTRSRAASAGGGESGA